MPTTGCLRIGPQKGAKDPREPRAVALPPGSGPRHVAFAPSWRRLYAINELASTITAFGWDAGSGVLTSGQTISTLPAGFTGANTTAEIAVHPSGRFLYGSNRGHDSIAVFGVDRTSGSLRLIEHEPTGGRTPRNFAVDPGRALARGREPGLQLARRVPHRSGDRRARTDRRSGDGDVAGVCDVRGEVAGLKPCPDDNVSGQRFSAARPP